MNNINPEQSVLAQQNLDKLTVDQVDPIAIPPAIDGMIEERIECEEVERLRAFRDAKQDIEFRQIIGDYVESPSHTVEPAGFLENSHELQCNPLFFFIPDKVVFDRADPTGKSTHAEEAFKRLNPYFYWCAAVYITDLNRYAFMYRKYYWVGSEIYRNATVIETFNHRSSIATALLNFIEMWGGHGRTQLDALKFYAEATGVEEFKEGTLGRFLAGVDVGMTQVWHIYQKAYESIGFYDLVGKFWGAIEDTIEKYDADQYAKAIALEKLVEEAKPKVNPKAPNKRGRGLNIKKKSIDKSDK